MPQMGAIATVDEYLARLPDPLREIAATARRVIDAGLAGGIGRMWHGNPTWMIGAAPVALIKAYTSYVTFGLFQGRLVSDPARLLVPGAREMAYLRLRTLADIDELQFARWLSQARELAAAPEA